MQTQMKKNGVPTMKEKIIRRMKIRLDAKTNIVVPPSINCDGIHYSPISMYQEEKARRVLKRKPAADFSIERQNGVSYLAFTDSSLIGWTG
jgi:hypothetical protein